MAVGEGEALESGAHISSILLGTDDRGLGPEVLPKCYSVGDEDFEAWYNGASLMVSPKIWHGLCCGG